jgi:hypothetical protein
MTHERRFEPPPDEHPGDATEHAPFLPPPGPSTPLSRAADKLIERWAGEPGVEAISQTATAQGADALRVMVTDEPARRRIKRRLPGQVDGFPVLLEVTGPFRAT